MKNVSDGFEGTDYIQISNISFYSNRFPILTIGSTKSMSRYTSQLLSKDSTHLEYTI